MTTFADMVTLLLCFFVLLLSFANQDVEKFRDMLGSVQDAFGVQQERRQDVHIAYSPTLANRKDLNLKVEQRKQLVLSQMIKDMVNKDPAIKKQVQVNAENGGVLFRVKDQVIFKPGSTEFTAGAYRALDKVIKVLKEHTYDLIVEGHTADTKEKGNRLYPSNWELSSARAAAALRYIMEKGQIPAKRLKAVGYAGTRPLVPNDSEVNRNRNRRVEFFFRPPAGKGMRF
jgi:chemotaxis protein MotB